MGTSTNAVSSRLPIMAAKAPAGIIWSVVVASGFTAGPSLLLLLLLLLVDGYGVRGGAGIAQAAVPPGSRYRLAATAR